MQKPNKSPIRAKSLTIIKAALSFGLLGWLYTRIDAAELLLALGRMPLMVGLGSLALFFLATTVGALKWFLLIRDCRYRFLLKLTFIAQYYAILLPGQIAAEIVKIQKSLQVCNEPRKIIASVLFDRLSGWMALLMVGLFGLSVSRSAEVAKLKPHFALAFVLLAVGTIVIRLGIVERVLNWIAGNPAAAYPGLERATAGVSAMLASWRAFLGRPYLMFQSLCWGVIFHLLGAAIFFLISKGIQAGVSFVDWCWLFAAISLVLLLPVAVGGIGLREGGLVAMLGWLGVPAEKALAVSLSFFGLQLVAALIGMLMEIGARPRRRTSANIKRVAPFI